MEEKKKSFKESFLEGTDVPTIIGIAAILKDDGGMIPYANAVVDYSSMAEEHRESYAKTFEEGWNEKHFHRGFNLNRKSPTIVTVSSKRETLAIQAENDDLDILRAPSFFVDLYGDEGPINEFYKFAETHHIWVFHIKTTAHSYFWTISYPDGQISNSFRREPMELLHKGGFKKS